MFITPLILIAISLGLVIALYRWPVAGVICLALCLGIGLLLSDFFGLWLAFVLATLAAIWTACTLLKVKQSRFALIGTLSVLAAYGVALGAFVPRWQEIRRLDEQYPVVQLKERLAYERQRSTDSTQEFSGSPIPMEQDVAKASESVDWWWMDDRRNALASLERTHDSFFQAFSEQEEFGWIRMRHLPAREHHIRLPERPPLRLERAPPVAGSTNAGGVDQPRSIEELLTYHHTQALEFVNPKGFGFLIDGEMMFADSGLIRLDATRARGFEPHSFARVPSSSPVGAEWRLSSLQLVSLLKHDPPAVYLSEHLPRMQELAADDVPTRTMNDFETVALERLREGEPVVAVENENRIRMFGALRAGQSCLQCHSVKERQLLGAFTYEFVKTIPVPPVDASATAPLL